MIFATIHPPRESLRPATANITAIGSMATTPPARTRPVIRYTNGIVTTAATTAQ